MSCGPSSIACRLRFPANDRHDVVYPFTRRRDNTSSVLEDTTSIDTTADWATGQNLLCHVVCTLDAAVLRDGRIGVAGDCATEAAGWEGAAGLCNILRCAAPILALADALVGLRGACHVRVGGIVRD